MRTILIFFGISFAIFFGLQFGLNIFFPPYQSIASEFFDSISTKEYKAAYILLSSDFRKKIDFHHFENFIENSEYKDYRSGRWFNAVVGPDKGTMDGVITLKSSKQMPLEFSFIKEQAQTLPTMPIPISNEMKKSLGPVMVWKIDEIRHAPIPSKPLP